MRVRNLVGIAVLLAMSAAFFTPSVATPDDLNPGVVPIDAKAWSKTYGEWAEKYWNWVL